MNLAFVLFRYFPYGGLQRDMLAIARMCYAKGHNVTVITREWHGEIESGIDVEIINVKGMTNHRKDVNFSRYITPALKKRFDVIVGFNKMANLDMYYAADSCFAEKVYQQRPWWYRLTSRAKHYLTLERDVFQVGLKTHALMISKNEVNIYKKYYNTEVERLHYLPPGIKKDRIRPLHAAELNQKKRMNLGIKQDENVVIFVGSGFKTKGLDRAIKAIGALSPALLKKTSFWILGQDKEKPFKQLAKQLGIDDKVHFLGGRDDVAEWLWMADVLIHPAYRENTGTVLLEAMVAGCPVITTDACGYADYVRSANMGLVIEQPFEQEQLNHALTDVLGKADADHWHEKGKQFAATADIYSMTQRAVEIIEAIGEANNDLVG